MPNKYVKNTKNIVLKNFSVKKKYKQSVLKILRLKILMLKNYTQSFGENFAKFSQEFWQIYFSSLEFLHFLKFQIEKSILKIGQKGWSKKNRKTLAGIKYCFKTRQVSFLQKMLVKKCFKFVKFIKKNASNFWPDKKRVKKPSKLYHVNICIIFLPVC
mgnify:CR=1 FL=1